MKRIRFLREPRGGNYVSKVENMTTELIRSVNLGKVVAGTVLEIPDEIADLLAAPRCPECGSVFPDPIRYDLKTYPRTSHYCYASKPGDMIQLVPGIAEEVET